MGDELLLSVVFSAWLFTCHFVLMMFLWPLECQDISKGTFKYYGLSRHKPVARHFLNHRIKWDVFQERKSRELSFQPEYGILLRNFFSGSIWIAQFWQFLVVCVPLFTRSCSCLGFKIMQLQIYINVLLYVNQHACRKQLKQVSSLCYKNYDCYVVCDPGEILVFTIDHRFLSQISVKFYWQSTLNC